MSQTKIKNKIPIKLKLAFISKKSIPSEQFQSEDTPAELTVKEALIALFFIFRQKLRAPKKKKPTHQNTVHQNQQTNQANQSCKNWQSKAPSGAAE